VFKATSTQVSPRLALLQPPAQPGAASSNALLFELPRRALLSRAARAAAPGLPPRSASEDGSGGRPGEGDGAGGVVAGVLELRNTLLGAAVQDRQARFIKDCSHYMQVRKKGGKQGLASIGTPAPRRQGCDSAAACLGPPP
jgi:hypothetical protein